MQKKDGKTQQYAGIYQEMTELIGEQAINKLYQNFRGQQIVFPMRLYNKEYVVKELLERYDGANLKQLALEFGYTERYLRTLIKQSKDQS